MALDKTAAVAVNIMWTRLVARVEIMWKGDVEAVLCNRGSVAVEFALLFAALVSTIIFAMLIVVILYFDQALDYATSKAARQIMVGSAPQSQANFQTQVCSYLPAAFNCANVIVNVQTAIESAQPGGYYAFVNSNQTGLIAPTLSNSSAQYSPGIQGSYEYIRVAYPITFIPSVFAAFLGSSTYQGAPCYVVISTAAFRNEQY